MELTMRSTDTADEDRVLPNNTTMAGSSSSSIREDFIIKDIASL